MIYGINGTPLSVACDSNGASISLAYDINGQQIFTNKYDDYQETRLYSNPSRAQGIEIHDDIIVMWREGASLSVIELRDALSGTIISTLSTTDMTTVHGNDISFSSEYYQSGDEFPLLYIGDKDGTEYCYRITRESATLLRTYSCSGYGELAGEFFDGAYLYTIGYKYNYRYSAGNYIMIMKWDMTNLTESDGVYIPEKVSEVHRDWLEAIQGVAYHDGLMWIACGLGGTGLNPGHIYALNVKTGGIMLDLPLSYTGELEGLAWGYNDADGWYMIVGNAGAGNYQITFEQQT